MTELRASIFIDQLQPQTLSYLSTWMRGTLPRSRMKLITETIEDIEVLTEATKKCGRPCWFANSRTSIWYIAISFSFDG